MTHAIEINIATLKSLVEKTVIITGGTSGIGFEAAKIFHSVGANVILADRNEARDDTSEILKSGRVRFVKCDVTDWDSMINVFETAKSTFGRVDVVCANAGISDTENLFFGLKTDGNGRPKAPDISTLKVDLDGTIYTVSLAFHYLLASGGGNIVITASMAGYLGLPDMPIYAAAKHGLVGLMRSLKSTAASRGIAISLVAPGMTPTPIMASLPGVTLGSNYTTGDLDRLYANIRASGIPANKTATVARAIAYLANEGLTVSGQGLMVLGDEISELEEPLINSWPQWLLDATDFIRNPAGEAVYDAKSSRS